MIVLVRGQNDHLPHTQAAILAKCQLGALPPIVGEWTKCPLTAKGHKIKWSNCPLENRRSGSTYINPLQISLCCFLLVFRRCLFVLCFPQSFLPFALPLDLRRIPAIIRAVFNAVSCRGKNLAAVFASKLTATFLCCFLPVILSSAIHITEQLCR